MISQKSRNNSQRIIISPVFVIYLCYSNILFDHIRQLPPHFALRTNPNTMYKYFCELQVMWLRRNTDWASLLTLGNTTHISDSRYSVSFQYPNNWRLAISGVRREDHGVYVCQVNTHPPRMLVTNVTVLGNVMFLRWNKRNPGQNNGYIDIDITGLPDTSVLRADNEKNVITARTLYSLNCVK